MILVIVTWLQLTFLLEKTNTIPLYLLISYYVSNTPALPDEIKLKHVSVYNIYDVHYHQKNLYGTGSHG